MHNVRQRQFTSKHTLQVPQIPRRLPQADAQNLRAWTSRDAEQCVRRTMATLHTVTPRMVSTYLLNHSKI